MNREGLERAAARHWQAPETEPLGQWILRAAQGFTGRANSALAIGHPGRPLPEAVAAVTAWYRHRGLPPMIAIPLPLHPGRGAGEAAGPQFDAFLAERSWRIRSVPAFVMTAAIADLPTPPSENTVLSENTVPSENTVLSENTVRLDPEPDAAWLALYRYRGQDLPPIARTLLLSAPWQAFASIRTDPDCLRGPAAAVGRVSVAGSWAAITAVEVDSARRRQGLGGAITAAMAAAAARRGARHVLLQVEADNSPARALYARCGFRDVHRYHYRIAPPA